VRFTCRLTHNWYGIKFIWSVELPGLVCKGRIVERLVLQWFPCDVILASVLSEKPVPVIAIVDVTPEVRCNLATFCRLKKNMKVFEDLNKINKVVTIFREESTSALASFHCGDVYLDWIGIWRVGFCEGRKTGGPGEKPSEQWQNQQQAQLPYGTRPLHPVRRSFQLCRNIKKQSQAHQQSQSQTLPGHSIELEAKAPSPYKAWENVCEWVTIG